MAKKPTIEVERDEINPEPVKVIAANIIEIAAAMKRINETRLTRDAVITLISRSVNGTISRTDINTVLDRISDLEKIFLKNV